MRPLFCAEKRVSAVQQISSICESGPYITYTASINWMDVTQIEHFVVDRENGHKQKQISQQNSSDESDLK